MDGSLLLPLAAALLLQTPAAAEFPLTPRWTQGQELVYRGSLHETSQGQGVQFSRRYQLEARAFVLDVPQPGVVHLAAFTRVTLAAANGEKAEAASLRLEVGRLDESGRFQPRHARTPYGEFEGPDSFEDGYLVELPRGAVRGQSAWSLETPGEPPRTLRLVGAEDHAGATCLKLALTQQSEDWDQPRGDRSAWRSETFLWVHPRTGFVQKLERVLLGRPAAHRAPTYRLTASYELESQLRYEGRFFEDRKREIELHQELQHQLRGYGAPGTRTIAGAYEALVDRLDRALGKLSATPYRDALLRLREQALAARQRQLPAPVVESGEAPKERLGPGQPAPDFIVRSLDGGAEAGLRTWRGKAALFVFFHPKASSAPLLLPAIQKLAQETAGDPKIAIVGMAMADDEAELRRCRERFNLTFPIFAGTSLRQSYEVAATPHLVLVDAGGKIAEIRSGWGPESALGLAAELKLLGGPSPKP